MSNTDSNRRKPAAVAVLVILLACIGLAACGSSSKSSSTGTNAAATTTATATATASTATGTTTSTTGTTGTGGSTGTGVPGAKGPNSSRFAALRECLQKNGVTLPKRTPGQRHTRGAGGGFLGGGAGAPQLPKGVTRAQYEAALKKCGGGTFATRPNHFNSPAIKTALAKFATCMSQNGVKIPAPNTSGKGPVFDTKGIDTTSAQFRTAETKCQSDLSEAFHRPGAGGPGGGPGAGGAPPAG